MVSDTPSQRAQDTLHLLKSRQYPALDASLNALQQRFDALELPESLLYSSFEVFWKAEDLEAGLNAWVEQCPNSYAAKLARGTFLAAEGHRQRGGATADQVSQPEWKAMNACFDRAYQDLLESLALAQRPVLSYVRMMYLEMVGGGREGVDNLEHHYRKALEVYPPSFQARLMRLNTLRAEWGGRTLQPMQSFLQDASHSVLSAEERQKLQAHYHYNAGHWLAHFVQDYPAAIREYSTAITLKPDLHEAYWKRGYALFKQKHFREALQDFEQQLQVDSQSDDAYFMAGWVLIYELEQVDKGKHYLRKAASLGHQSAGDVLRDLEQAQTPAGRMRQGAGQAGGYLQMAWWYLRTYWWAVFLGVGVLRMLTGG